MPETTAVAWAEALDRVLSRYQKNAESVLQVCIDLQEEVHFVPPRRRWPSAGRWGSPPCG